MRWLLGSTLPSYCNLHSHPEQAAPWHHTGIWNPKNVFAFIPKLSFTQGSTLGFHSGDFQTCNYSLVRSHSRQRADLFTAEREGGEWSPGVCVSWLSWTSTHLQWPQHSWALDWALGIKGLILLSSSMALQRHSGKFACRSSNNSLWYWMILGELDLYNLHLCVSWHRPGSGHSPVLWPHSIVMSLPEVGKDVSSLVTTNTSERSSNHIHRILSSHLQSPQDTLSPIKLPHAFLFTENHPQVVCSFGPALKHPGNGGSLWTVFLEAVVCW